MTENSPAHFRRTLHRAWLEIAIFSVLMNVLLLVPSLYMMQIYDRVLPAASIPTLVYLSLIAVAALALMALLDIVRSIYCQRVGLSLERNFGSASFMATLSSARAKHGEIQPLRDLATVRAFIASRGLTNLIDLPFAPLFIILLYLIHPVLSLVTTAGALVLIIVVVANQFAARRSITQSLGEARVANSLAQAFVGSADTIRGLGMLMNVSEVWGRKFAEAALSQDRATSINSIFAGISRASRMALQLAILGSGAALVMAGELTGGMIFASSIISGRALQPIDQLIAGWKQVVEARAAWKRLNEATVAVAAAHIDRIRLPDPLGKISVRDLLWAPPGTGGLPIIKRISFEVRAGEVIAILGPSSAGKSTLVKLLAGALRPTAGSIFLDEADYKTWDEHQLGSQIGYLPQEVQLLPGTIAANISRFDLDASDSEIIGAAQRAEAHALISAQKDGYQTSLSSSDTSLSGGVRQRVGLARAFFRNPKVLILDEPNSNLDADGEAALDRAIVAAKAAGNTILIVTHRPGIIARCDKALVMREGSVEVFGPAPEVLERLSAAARNAVKRPMTSQSHNSPTAGLKAPRKSFASGGGT
ncbi:type I secretion system permease/ATPase [Shinella sp. PSBB067]|uniref:type I secretion system permease/ATPase n=1 Tax=Shinella sp. PSBB067 TaxID=2715959 RepID=UPI001E5C56A1|nr:type I secretion system permease/ATPase [Shinella sp. PSBB067]